MKKMVFFILLLFAMIGECKAMKTEVVLHLAPFDKEDQPIRHAPPILGGMPTIMIDEDTVIVSFGRNNSSVSLTLLDLEDNTLFYGQGMLINGILKVNVSDNMLVEVKKISVIINGKKYIGEII